MQTDRVPFAIPDDGHEAGVLHGDPVFEPVADVALHVGYGDLAAFRRLFQRHTGLTTTDYRRRYGDSRRRIA